MTLGVILILHISLVTTVAILPNSSSSSNEWSIRKPLLSAEIDLEVGSCIVMDGEGSMVIIHGKVLCVNTSWGGVNKKPARHP